MKIPSLSRREFLELSALGFGSSLFTTLSSRFLTSNAFPLSERLVRVCVGKVELKARPSDQAQKV